MAKVLVIDDTLAMVDLIREMLRMAGHEVHVCLVSSRALAMIASVEPDVVILDIVMPEVSGWDILAALRADPRTQRLPVIICTAWAEIAAGRLRERPDPSAWLLPKPFDQAELLELVRGAVGRR